MYRHYNAETFYLNLYDGLMEVSVLFIQNDGTMVSIIYYANIISQKSLLRIHKSLGEMHFGLLLHSLYIHHGSVYFVLDNKVLDFHNTSFLVPQFLLKEKDFCLFLCFWCLYDQVWNHYTTFLIHYKN